MGVVVTVKCKLGSGVIGGWQKSRCYEDIDHHDDKGGGGRAKDMVVAGRRRSSCWTSCIGLKT
jgi:hypothetical protein